MTSSPSFTRNIIDINATEVNKNFIEEKFLKQNLPCIIRQSNTHQEENALSLLTPQVWNLEQSLMFVKKICLASSETEISLIEKEFKSFIQEKLLLVSSSSSSFISSNSVKNNNNNHIASKILATEVDVETSFRKYESMKLKQFFLHHQQEQEDDSDDDDEAVPSWYLKDWHFAEWLQNEIIFDNNHKEEEKVDSAELLPLLNLYSLPEFLKDFAQDDILQKFQRSSSISSSSKKLPQKFGPGQEYRFVYIGGKNSATLPHFDVCATYSWSLNLSGTKVWKFPSSHELNEKVLTKFFVGGIEAHRNQERLLREEGKFDHLEDLIALSSTTDDRSNEEEMNLNNINLGCQEIIQKPGDIMLVPALWVHEVRNVTSCVSVNHNWYVFPFSLRHILRLIENEVALTLKMIGEDSIEILKKDRDEWELLFNLTHQGSNNWCLNVLKRLLEFASSSRKNTNNDENAIVAIENAKKRIEQIEDMVLN